jgi:tetratricopeptide (TPR) repeat protein
MYMRGFLVFAMKPLTIDQVMQAAISHHQAGRHAQAKKLYEAVLAQEPEHAHALCLLALLINQQGKGDIAVGLIHRAIVLRPNDARFHFHLGNVQRERRHFADAITAYRRAIQLSPDDAEAFTNLAIALREFGQAPESVSAAQRAVELQPREPRTWNNLGVCLSAAEDPVAAILAYRHAIALSADYAEAFHNLGKAYAISDQFDQAIDAFRRAIAIKPDFAAALGDLSNALKHEGRLDESLATAQRALELAPDSAEAHCRMALMLLRKGELERGWAEYEWRYRINIPWKFSHPRWHGEDLRGRTLLLHADQGLGDTVQFIRYAPLIAARGGRVIVRCQRQLKRLLSSLPGVDQTLSEDDPLPDFDLHCPIISLPVAFKTNLATVPAAIPYLRPPTAVVRAWRDRLKPRDSRLKVGLVWAGHPSHSNDRHRSTTLASIARLQSVNNVAFHSLQVGPAQAEAIHSAAPIELIDLTPDITDFADTAAIIEHLDLVIAVDTSTAHVAAAMGKPVWMLLPFVAEWRWLIGRCDTPWYPTMRLFRQPRLNDWAGAVSQLIEPLQQIAART